MHHTEKSAVLSRLSKLIWDKKKCNTIFKNLFLWKKNQQADLFSHRFTRFNAREVARISRKEHRKSRAYSFGGKSSFSLRWMWNLLLSVFLNPNHSNLHSCKQLRNFLKRLDSDIFRTVYLGTEYFPRHKNLWTNFDFLFSNLFY